MQDFSEEVLNVFSVTASGFGLRCVARSGRLVRLENDTIYFQVHYDEGRSFELGAEIGRLGEKGPGFSIGEVLRLMGRLDDANWMDRLQIVDKEVLFESLLRLANLVAPIAKDLFSPNSIIFLDLERLRKLEAEQHAISRALDDARSKANEAWKTKNFKKIVEAYAPVRDYLSKAEVKRLIYAEEHIDNE